MKTKSILLTCLFALFASMTMSAQSIIKGDMNNDNDVTIADVTSLVNVVLGKSPIETINVGGSPYMVDNSSVVGTWYAPDGTNFTLNEDGSTNFTGAATYKFRPYQGTLMMFNASGNPIKTLVLNEVETSYLLAIDYATGAYTYYTNSGSLATGITLSQTSLSMNSGTTAQLSATLTPEEAIGSITWTSSDESIAIVDANGLVTAVDRGACTIIATTVDGSGVTATCEVIVYRDESGSINGRDYVDLGLPSGTLWATCNIGASSPEDYGDYFAWGETTGYNDGKTTFDERNYKWCNGSERTMTKYCTNSSYGNNGFTDNKTELDLEDDAAYVNWGAVWRMPSYEQFQELIDSDYTTTEWTIQNGVNGWKITSKMEGFTNKSIFLPAGGWRSLLSLLDEGSYGDYWSRTLDSDYPWGAWSLYFSSSDFGPWGSSRWVGFSVRPVRNTTE